MNKIVLIIGIDSGGRVLLQHRDNDPRIGYPNQWSPFGGHMEPNETSSEAAKRELKEETGIVGKELVLFAQDMDVPNRKKKYDFYLCTFNEPVAIDLQEGQGYGFFNKGYALESLDLSDSARFALMMLP